jgi:hypothetical protein
LPAKHQSPESSRWRPSAPAHACVLHGPAPMPVAGPTSHASNSTHGAGSALSMLPAPPRMRPAAAATVCGRPACVCVHQMCVYMYMYRWMWMWMWV